MRWLSPPWLACGLALWALAACSEDPRLDAPRIDRLVPAEVSPGEGLRLEGSGFGAAPGAVALGGRPVPVEGWGPDAVTVRLPPDLPRGESLVVLTTQARTRTPPAPIRVLGVGRRPEVPRRFPDGGRPALDGGPRDARPRPDLGPEDASPPPDLALQPLVAVFSPDPGGEDAVSVQAQDSPPGLLRLELILPPVVARASTGLALHLAYDANLLAFQQVAPAEGPDVIAREIGPGRLAVMRAAPPSRALVLTFRLVGPGEGRVEVPARHRALRDRENRDRVDVRWAGGSVRVRPEAP